MMNLWKIIQILKAARLLLLVVLLLIVLIGKFARAETAYLYKNSVDTEFYGSPAAACAPLRPGARPGPVANNIGYEGTCQVDHNGQPSTVGFYVKVSKTCEAKELTHNGNMGAGYYNDDPRLSRFFWKNGPPGIDAGDWYSDKFTSCENNCVVRNTREFMDPSDVVRADGRSVREDDGTTSSMFTKRQTGEVCVVEKNDPTKPPSPPPPDPPDTDNGADNGTGQSDPGNSEGGSESGNQGESGSGDGEGDQSGTGDSGESGNGGGSGGGSGGSSGGGGSTGVGGGSSDTGGDGSGEGDGSEDGTDTGQDGGSTGGEGSGEGSGQGSDNQGGGNQVGEGDEGDGEEEGSISGGSCSAEQAPSCKGDPIQCYIAVEQWRTACAASGKSNSISGGNCKTGIPPECKGDATQCYIATEEWKQSCAAIIEQGRADELEEYGKGKVGDAQSFADGSGFDGIGDAIKDNDSVVNIPSQLDTSGFGWSRTCPALQFNIETALFGSFAIDFSMICGLANLIGNLFVAVSLVLSARYILR